MPLVSSSLPRPFNTSTNFAIPFLNHLFFALLLAVIDVISSLSLFALLSLLLEKIIFTHIVIVTDHTSLHAMYLQFFVNGVRPLK